MLSSYRILTYSAFGMCPSPVGSNTFYFLNISFVVLIIIHSIFCICPTGKDPYIFCFWNVCFALYIQ